MGDWHRGWSPINRGFQAQLRFVEQIGISGPDTPTLPEWRLGRKNGIVRPERLDDGGWFDCRIGARY